jgi:hypothetical protein
MGSVLGVLGLIVFIVCVVGFAAGITWLVVKVFPSGSKKKPEAQPS